MNVGIRMTNIGEYIKVFVVDTVKEEMYVMDMPNTLKDMKSLTGTTCVEFGTIYVSEHRFRIIYGPNANAKMHISAIDTGGKTLYRGNIIVVASTIDANMGETLTDLTDDDVTLLMANTGLMYIDSADGTPYNAYILCNVVDEAR